MIDWSATTLRPLSGDDLPRLHEWQNDPGLRALTMGFRGPVQRDTTAEWLRTLAAETLRSRVAFGIGHGAELAGLAQLHGIDWIHRSASLGIHLGTGARGGPGIGFVAASLLLDYAFNGLDLVRIGLTVLAGNTRAIRLYERLGFQREGTLRSAFLIDGRREDVAAYAILRPDWPGGLPLEANRLIQGAVTA